MKLKTYSELVNRHSFLDRFEYLSIGGTIGVSTFGHSRYINQRFYNSRLWRSIRNEIIIRDNGCDLGIPNLEIYDRIIIHHLNPITEEDIENLTDLAINPEFLICASFDTHNAIHLGDSDLLPILPIERSMNDTSPWLL